MTKEVIVDKVPRLTKEFIKEVVTNYIDRRKKTGYIAVSLFLDVGVYKLIDSKTKYEAECLENKYDFVILRSSDFSNAYYNYDTKKGFTKVSMIEILYKIAQERYLKIKNHVEFQEKLATSKRINRDKLYSYVNDTIIKLNNRYAPRCWSDTYPEYSVRISEDKNRVIALEVTANKYYRDKEFYHADKFDAMPETELLKFVENYVGYGVKSNISEFKSAIKTILKGETETKYDFGYTDKGYDMFSITTFPIFIKNDKDLDVVVRNLTKILKENSKIDDN